MQTMWKVLGIMGIGAACGALVFYKMKNPECINDMKDALDNMTKKTSKTMKNMME